MGDDENRPQKESQAVVPSLFALETANVAANVATKVESKGVVTEADVQRFITLLGRLNIVTDQATSAHALGDTGAINCQPMMPLIWSYRCARACRWQHWMPIWRRQPQPRAFRFSVRID